ncbi:Initiation factor 2B-related protein [Corchorus olitorius]|uniref:Initiation factor 2B-related protein n=1 Tax=Corchorus olitorius TaxID=93759 RepID=A0A1R3GKP4_9ROSI|nr:Initiation factor 2B-related protein [Corchorus olitorius]
MIKVHPLEAAAAAAAPSLSLPSFPSSPSSSSNYITSRKETFTVWMKSLVMQGNGCTVYDENGEIVYRIDNYDKKCSNEVCIMDLQGKVLFTILKKNQWFFRRWVGDRYNDLNLNTEKFHFQVRKSLRNIVKGDLSCQVICVNGQTSCYRVKGLAAGKSAFQITEENGKLVAEAKRKESSSGVLLGEDVLALEVEAHVDHCLIMALVTVYGLLHNTL